MTLPQRAERLAALGLLAWGGLWIVPVHSVLGFPLVERLVAAGPLLAVPLALAARRDSNESSLRRVLFWSQLPAALLMAASATLPPGISSAALAVPWLLWTVGFALYTMALALRRGLLPLDKLAVDAGFGYLAIGAVWWLAARAEFPLLGFDPVLVVLTAAHFHFAGLAASVIAGSVGRLLGDRLAHLYRAAVVLVVGTPILVALGILGSPALEVATAVLLALGVLGLAFSMASAAWIHRRVSALAALALLLSAGVSLATMSLAIYYAIGEFGGWHPPNILTMVQTHGALNVLGFCLPALVGVRLLDRAPG